MIPGSLGLDRNAWELRDQNDVLSQQGLHVGCHHLIRSLAEQTAPQKTSSDLIWTFKWGSYRKRKRSSHRPNTPGACIREACCLAWVPCNGICIFSVDLSEFIASEKSSFRYEWITCQMLLPLAVMEQIAWEVVKLTFSWGSDILYLPWSQVAQRHLFRCACRRSSQSLSFTRDTQTAYLVTCQFNFAKLAGCLSPYFKTIYVNVSLRA